MKPNFKFGINKLNTKKDVKFVENLIRGELLPLNIPEWILEFRFFLDLYRDVRTVVF
jgi:hypothetical protein